MLIGYARCSTDAQDVEVQMAGLRRLKVAKSRTYVDHGYTGGNRERPALANALAALRPGDVLVVTALDRLGRSMVDLRQIAAEVTEAGAALNIGGSLHDPDDPIGVLFFNILASFAEFEAQLNRTRTLAGLAEARARGRRIGGSKPRLTPAQRAHMAHLWAAGEHSQRELGELFGLQRSAVSRYVAKFREEANLSGVSSLSGVSRAAGIA